MLDRIFFLIVFALVTISSNAQTSTITGKIVDLQSGYTIPGAAVVLQTSTDFVGASSDMDGNFKIENVPVGRHSIQISFLGYETRTLSNLLVSSAKELNVTVQLEESIEKLNEVVISAEADKVGPINEMSTVSARQFTIEEAQRYSGALQDPARMATNFAGVSGANNSRNDIIIRGNSPIGVLWRMEGIDIPSPNHFSSTGTTGGPVSMLNLNNLSNSDFMTGAWTAQYGNALSGVFDLNLREGSTEDYQFLGQVGFNGFELGAEGPLGKKKKASFLLNYRYSTLGVFGALGVNLGTGAAIPQYQDLTFNVSLPTDKIGKFTIFGFGGVSDIEFKGEDSDSLDLFSDAFTDSRFATGTGMVGASHSYFLNNTTLSKLVVATSTNQERGAIDSLTPNYESSAPIYGQLYNQDKYSVNYKINKKFNAKNTAVIGVIYDHYEIEMLDSVRMPFGFVNLTDMDGSLDLIQGYAQWQHKFNKKWTLNSGLHGQVLTLNNSQAIEPRIGLKYKPVEKHSFNAGVGLHSQMQPVPVYFMLDPDGLVKGETNRDLNFTRSWHYILGHDFSITQNLRLKTELYYQYLFDVPIDKAASPYSMLNQGADFGFENKINLENGGEGQNYGVEITLEKFFSKGFYFLTTTSVFDAKYKGSDGIERNTAFNSNYVVNALGGKEFQLGDKGMSLSFDTKFNLAGGRRYTPIDLEESRKRNEEYRDPALAYTEQFDPYFRWDFKITFRQNKEKFSHQFSVDLQNVTANKNVFAYGYNNRSGNIGTTYQRGFFPDVLYRIYF